MTGGRLAAVRKYVEADDLVMFTYGDGVADVDIKQLVAFHRSHGKIATVTAVRPPGRFGELSLDGRDRSPSSTRSRRPTAGFINGGFFVFDARRIWDYLTAGPGLRPRGRADAGAGPRSASWSPTSTPGSGSRWTPCASTTCSTSSGHRGARPGRSGRDGAGFWLDRPTLVTGATGLVGSWLVSAPGRGGRRRRLPRARLGSAERAGPRLGDRAGQGRARRRARSGAARARPRRERDRHRHPPGRADDRDDRQPQPGLHVRDERRRDLVRCSRPAGAARRSSRSSWPRRTRPTAITRRSPTPKRRRWSDGIPTTSASRARISSRRPTRRPTARRSSSRAAETSTAAAISTGTGSSREPSARSSAASGRSFDPTAPSSATTSTSRTAPSPTCCWPRSWRPTRRCAGAPSTFRTRFRSPCAQLVDRILKLMGSNPRARRSQRGQPRDRPPVPVGGRGAPGSRMEPEVLARRRSRAHDRLVSIVLCDRRGRRVTAAAFRCRSCGSGDAGAGAVARLDAARELAASRGGAGSPGAALPARSGLLPRPARSFRSRRRCRPSSCSATYLYFSSFSETMLAHARELVERADGASSLWAPSRSPSRSPATTATCCSTTRRPGIPVLGIEPAQNVARVAIEERGIPTLSEFFGLELAPQARRRGQARRRPPRQQRPRARGRSERVRRRASARSWRTRASRRSSSRTSAT